jgi:hypothetical protein
MDYVTVEDRIASAAVAGADSAAAAKSKRRSGDRVSRRRNRKEKRWQRLHEEAMAEMNANVVELLAHMPADYHPYVASLPATVESMSAEAGRKAEQLKRLHEEAMAEMNANVAELLAHMPADYHPYVASLPATVESMSAEAADELLAHMPAGYPRLVSSAATHLGETSVMEATLTCRHCGDRRLETEPPCGCDSVVAEFGSIGCDCCGYSYMDSRGQRDSPSSVTAGLTVLYYEQYGWWIREPCASCSPKFVERMRAVHEADHSDYRDRKEWEYEQVCRGSYW